MWPARILLIMMQLANLRRRLLTRVSQLLRPASLTHATAIVGRVGSLGDQRGLLPCARNLCFGMDYGLIVIALETGLLLAACGGPGPATTMPFIKIKD